MPFRSGALVIKATIIRSPARRREASDGLASNISVMNDTTDPIGVKDTSESDEPIREGLSDAAGSWSFKIDTADHTQSLTMAGADLATQTVTSSVAPAPAPITEFIIAEGGSAEIDGAGTSVGYLHWRYRHASD